MVTSNVVLEFLLVQKSSSNLIRVSRAFKEAKQHRRSLLTVWLDYKKAFDSVPHSWILESLRLAKVPSAIVDAINRYSLIRSVPIVKAMCETLVVH